MKDVVNCIIDEYIEPPIDDSHRVIEDHSMVNHPAHYVHNNGVECIDAIQAATEGLEGIKAVDTANAIKYLWRWKKKNGIQDLEKAIWYINHLIKQLKETN